MATNALNAIINGLWSEGGQSHMSAHTKSDANVTGPRVKQLIVGVTQELKEFSIIQEELHEFFPGKMMRLSVLQVPTRD
jgi:hypothetical protein